MLIISFLFFTFAALLGLLLLTYVLRNKETPKAVALIHGPLAVIGLLILVLYTLIEPSVYLLISIILFIFAAMGGGYLLYRDLTGKGIPKLVALGHGITAIIAILFLIYGYYY